LAFVNTPIFNFFFGCFLIISTWVFGFLIEIIAYFSGPFGFGGRRCEGEKYETEKSFFHPFHPAFDSEKIDGWRYF